MNRKVEYQLKAGLSRSEAEVDPLHLQKVLAQCHTALDQKERPKGISFFEFLKGQVKYTAWKIWGVQGVFLVFLCALLSAGFGNALFSKPQHIAILLGSGGILVFMTAIPFVQRGLRYQMQEIEAATRFSSVKLLAARLLIIGMGDGLMLGSLLLLALFQTAIPLEMAVLCILLPFLAVTSGVLYVLGHLPARRFPLCCAGICVAVFLLILGLCSFLPPMGKNGISAAWGLLCIALTLFSIHQLSYLLKRAALSEIQLT